VTAGAVVFPLVEVVEEPRFRAVCLWPYPGHLRGCPNYGHKPGCPPRTPPLDEVLDKRLPRWAVVNTFDLAAHVARLHAVHPTWSDRQLRCCLYWQGTARRQLEDRLTQVLAAHPGTVPVRCPEALGVNVTATLAQLGVALEWPPITYVRQVAFVGFPSDLRR
jgi:predicted metal-binding protein